MRIITLPVLLLAFCFAAAAQEKQQEPVKEEEGEKKKKREPMDKIIVDLTHDRWTKAPAGVGIKPYSIGVSGNVYFDLPFGSSPFSFAWGAGFISHNVHSNGAVVYRVDANGKLFTTLNPIQQPYSVNKLSLNYVCVPVELRLRSARKPTFRLFIGGKAGFLVNSHTKYTDASTKVKVYRIKNIDPLLYGATARIGIGRIQLTGFYSLSPLFKKGKGEAEMVPYSVGINIIPLVR